MSGQEKKDRVPFTEFYDSMPNWAGALHDEAVELMEQAEKEMDRVRGGMGGMRPRQRQLQTVKNATYVGHDGAGVKEGWEGGKKAKAMLLCNARGGGRHTWRANNTNYVGREKAMCP